MLRPDQCVGIAVPVLDRVVITGWQDAALGERECGLLTIGTEQHRHRSGVGTDQF